MTRSCGNVFGLCGNALAALGVCVLAHCAAFAAPKSFDECIGTASNGGGWSGNVAYDRATGRAKLDARDHVFTPSEPSSKKFVTIEATATFPVNDDNDHPGADVQAAVRIAPNGKFQVWTHLRQGYGGQAGNREQVTGNSWMDVEAEGVTPVGGKE
ncbi:MAG: hypothetical protein J6W80_02850, partial [Kiritimatiellae bacterium]|nr:hypothetical protein [Kiritimatiellia bacterium]